jgi:hypothetical protein
MQYQEHLADFRVIEAPKPAVEGSHAGNRKVEVRPFL